MRDSLKRNISRGEEKSWYVPLIMLCSAFLLYLVALLPIFVKRGLPFFYYGDYNVQQIPFYIVAHRAVRNGELLWNWNLDLGGSMAGDFSFYLWGSPFFWITTLFPEAAIPYLMPFLMALKYGICAMSAYIYIRRYVSSYIYAMIGGYLYAFSGFNACNIVFNHFTDAVAFFPLYLLLFENLMEVDDGAENCGFKLSGKPFVAFAVMTAIMSVINYYFFFGQIIFLIIYFVIRYARNNSLINSLRMFNRALAGGFLGFLLAGVFLMQAFAGVSGNSRLDNLINGYNMLVYPSEKMLWNILKSVSMLPDIIGKGTLFYTSTVKNASLAAYIPMFGISGVVAYFLLNREKKNWEKTLILTCMVMALIPVFNAVFSLFNSAYYARWFYMPILIMCLMTAQATEKGRTPQLQRGVMVAIVLFFFFILVYFLPTIKDDGSVVFFSMTDNKSIFIRDMIGTGILTILLILAAFFLPRKSEDGRRDKAIICLVIISCVIATYVPVLNGSSIITERGKEKWREQMLSGRVTVDESSFARGEVDSTSTNYDMVWGVPSIHCFLSTVPSEIFDFLKGSCNITRTVETSIPVDRVGTRALLSARYYFENAEISKKRTFSKGEGTPGYSYIKSENGFDVFENLNYIPMGFSFDYYIRESEWEDLEPEKHDYELARVLILPDDAVEKYGDTLLMTEVTAEDLEEEGLSYQEFTEECTGRRQSACTEFTTDTKGFSAKTAMHQDNTLIFFSVPATEGFSCTVDGKETEIIKCDYGLMAIPVSGGVHEIRVTYTAEGFKLGLYMTSSGVLLLLLYCILKKVKKSA